MSPEASQNSRIEKILFSSPVTVFMALTVALLALKFPDEDREMCNQIDHAGVERGKTLVSDLVRDSGRQYEIIESPDGKFTAIIPLEKYHGSIVKTLPLLKRYASDKAKFERWLSYQRGGNVCSMRATSAFHEAVKHIDRDFFYVDLSSSAPFLEHI